MKEATKVNSLNLITRLAFYLGWANAMLAVAVAQDIFHERGIGFDQLPPVNDKLMPLNEAREAQRATQVSSNFGHASPGMVENTTNLLGVDFARRSAREKSNPPGGRTGRR